MDPYLRILRAVPVIHPATVGRLIAWPDGEVYGDDRLNDVLQGLAHAWAQLHPQGASAHDVLAWARKQVPNHQVATILRLSAGEFNACVVEITGWLARGMIAPVPAPIADPGARADLLQRRMLIARL
ncbi:MAG: hypothetical protein EPN69_08415 [Rhodanobacter sp.]|nr:MAG: hypothetical protein EPN69_08415 [Rhodanobacter sp.]TAM40130.1 MAG: hypothetical protein EPN58_11640 [Rhodanobacter sp.]